MLTLPMALRPLLSFSHSDLALALNQNDRFWHQTETTKEGPFLESMVMRFKSVNGNRVYSTQLVGKFAGTETSNFFGNEDMWFQLDPLKPYLQQICSATGDIIHLVSVASYAGKTKRNPFFLCETFAGDDKQGARISGRTFSKCNQDGRYDGDRYIDYIAQANAAWLEKNNIMFADDNPLDLVIQAVQDGTITQQDLLAALKEIQAA